MVLNGEFVQRFVSYFHFMLKDPISTSVYRDSQFLEDATDPVHGVMGRVRTNEEVFNNSLNLGKTCVRKHLSSCISHRLNFCHL